MIKEDPPLLVIGDFSQSFQLHTLDKDTEIQKVGKINKNKFADFDRYEFLIDGMAFNLEFHDETETATILKDNCRSTIFGEPVTKRARSIGITLGQHLKSGHHVSTVNKALLRLAMTIGNAFSATHVAWLPANQSVGFKQYSEAVSDYLSGGPTPILIQIAVEKTKDSQFKTSGLSYFAEQEINLEAPTDMPDSEAIKRLVRISHDIAVNGRVDSELKASGMEEGETLSYRPSSNLSTLDVKITWA